MQRIRSTSIGESKQLLAGGGLPLHRQADHRRHAGRRGTHPRRRRRGAARLAHTGARGSPTPRTPGDGDHVPQPLHRGHARHRWRRSRSRWCSPVIREASPPGWPRRGSHRRSGSRRRARRDDVRVDSARTSLTRGPCSRTRASTAERAAPLLIADASMVLSRNLRGWRSRGATVSGCSRCTSISATRSAAATATRPSVSRGRCTTSDGARADAGRPMHASP